MEDAKLEAYYNELKASAPKGKTGGLGSLRAGKGGGFASAAQRSDAKNGRNAAKPAGTNNLYKMFVKAGEGGFVSYDDDGNIVEEKSKPEEDDGLVGLIPCMAKLKNDPSILKKLAKDKKNLNLSVTKKRKRGGSEEVGKTTSKRKKADKAKVGEAKPNQENKEKKEKKKSKKEKKEKKRLEEEAEVEAVLAAAAKVEAEKAAAASAVKLLRTKADFDSCLKSSKKTGAAVLVDFSATWCGPCQSIAPVFAKLASTYPNAVYAKVDADENQESCDTAGVTSFPMFHVYSLGKKVAELDGADKKALKKLSKQYAEPVEVKKKDKKKKKEKEKGQANDEVQAADVKESKKAKKTEKSAAKEVGEKDSKKKRKSAEKTKTKEKKEKKEKKKKASKK